MTKFESRFFRALNEQDQEQQAFNQSLDKGTNPEDFNAAPAGNENTGTEIAQHTAAAAESKARMHAQYIEKINGWLGKLEEFNEYLNGTTGSVQSDIAGAESDSILEDLSSEASRITRAATEIAALIQKFKTAISTENEPKYKGV